MNGGNLIRSSLEQYGNPDSSAAARAVESSNPDDDDDIGLVPGFFESHFFLWISTTMYASVAVYSGVMASLLSIFVPQLCCPHVTNTICFKHIYILILSRSRPRQLVLTDVTGLLRVEWRLSKQHDE